MEKVRVVLTKKDLEQQFVQLINLCLESGVPNVRPVFLTTTISLEMSFKNFQAREQFQTILEKEEIMFDAWSIPV